MLQELGADEVIDYKEQSVDQVFQDNPFDAVVDQIGGGSSPANPHLIWNLLLLLLLLLLFEADCVFWQQCLYWRLGLSTGEWPCLPGRAAVLTLVCLSALSKPAC